MSRFFRIAAIVTMFCFAWGLAAPVSGHSGERDKASVPMVDSGGGSSANAPGAGDPGFQEKPGVKKAAKKFPWLLAGLGAAAVVVAAIVLSNGKKTANSPASTAAYADGILTLAGQRYELASIPSGTFQMGSDSAAATPGEQPVHPVTISGFRMGRTEVTQGVWRAVMGSNPSAFRRGDNYPVENISWEDCQSFISRLNRLLGGNPFRLPTEAEWEYACRAATTGDSYGDLNSVAWYEVNSGSSTHPVGQKQANAWGLYDMLGNVWEWCQDWYDEYYYAHSSAINPQGPAVGSRRVDRGGGWDNGAQYVRAACRYSIGPSESYHALGFRLASD